MPSLVQAEIANNSQQIRNLLSMDGRVSQASNIKFKAISEKKPITTNNTTSTTAVTPTVSPTTPSLSPGQSLIRKLRVTTAASTPRQVFTASNDSSRTRTISLILGSSKTSSLDNGGKNVSIPVSREVEAIPTSTEHSHKSNDKNNEVKVGDEAKLSNADDEMQYELSCPEQTEQEQKPDASSNICHKDESSKIDNTISKCGVFGPPQAEQEVTSVNNSVLANTD